MSANEPCPRCGELTDDHTVRGLRTCLSDLYDHDLPFEERPVAAQNVDCITAGSVAVKAGVQATPVGTFPVLVFEFSGPEGPVPPIALVLDDTHMRSVRTLVGSAIDAAVRAARKARK